MKDICRLRVQAERLTFQRSKLCIKHNNLTVQADWAKKKKTQQIENERMEIILTL